MSFPRTHKSDPLDLCPRTAFENLYAVHAPAIKAYLAKRGWMEQADDIAQEVFLRAWRGRETFRRDSSFQTFLIGITRKVVVDFMRRRMREDRMQLSMQTARESPNERGIPGIPGSLDPVFTNACSRDLHRSIQQRITGLPAIYRQAVELSVLLGMNSTDAARQAGCPEKVFRNRLYRALKILRDCMREFSHRA